MNMARNHGSNNSGLLWIIGILFFLGTVALFNGSLDASPLLWICIIIGDVFIAAAIIKAISERPAANTLPQVPSSQLPSRQPDTPDTSPVSSAAAQEASQDRSKLKQLKSKYRVPGIPPVGISIDPLQNEMKSCQCIEVLRSVNRAAGQRKDYAEKLGSIKAEMDGILACPGCSTDKDRISHISGKEEILRQKKAEYTKALKEMKKVRIVLLEKGKAAFNSLYSALAEISSSMKSAGSSGIELSSFIELNSSIPGSLFVSEQAPVKLDYGAYNFFLLPDAILAYDKAGSFVTAFEPMALIITFKPQKKSVYMRRRNGASWSYADPVIAKDSALVSQGASKTSWLHERKSGGPDLRYSDNPSYESRTDTYAYTDVCIQLGRFKAEYLISKAGLSNKLNPMVKDYCSVTHESTSAPSLLRLLESASKKKEAASLLSEKYEDVSKNVICKVSSEDK